MQLPKAIIFDMDGTLVDNIPYHRDAWLMFLEENGIRLSPEDFHAQNHGTLTEMMARFFPDITDPALLNAKGQQKEETYRKLYRPHLREINGLGNLLEKLQQSGVELLLATMGDIPNIDFTLDGLGIRSYFSHITGGHEVEKGKPDPEIFLKTLDKAGLSPKDCLVIEDSLGGVAAAVRAGIPVIGITTTQTAAELLGAGCLGVGKDFLEVDKLIFKTFD